MFIEKKKLCNNNAFEGGKSTNTMDDSHWEYNVQLDPTSLAGNCSKEEIKRELARVRKVFDGLPVQGYFDGTPATYALRVKPSHAGPYLYMEIELRGDWKRYVRPEHQKGYSRWKREGEKKYHIDSDLLMTRTLVNLFPHHKLAIVNNSDGFEKDLPRGSAELVKLGYQVISPRREYDEQGWTTEAQTELLLHLRSPETLCKAFDARATQILQSIQERLPEIETFTFATYSPWRVIKGTGWQRDNYKTRSEKKEEHVNPVKSLEEIPATWIPQVLEQRCKNLPLNHALGLTSKVQTSSGVYHLPMIDFAAGNHDVKFALEKLHMPGIVVNSGNAGHFYGFHLLEEDEWRKFMEEIKQHDWVCRNWPALQREQGYSLLRLTPCRYRLSQPCGTRKVSPPWTRERTTSEEKSPAEILAAA